MTAHSMVGLTAQGILLREGTAIHIIVQVSCFTISSYTEIDFHESANLL